MEAASIEAIAAAAGVSKVTLYRHYPDKAALFRAAVEREMERIEAMQRHPPGRDGAAIDELRAFGLGIVAFLASKPAIDFYSAVAGELRRHGELARAFHELGPGRTHGNLTRLIAAAAGRGELSVADPARAAEELFGLWQGFTNFRFALGIDVEEIRDDLPGRVERGLAVFMAAYGPGATR